MVSLKNLPLELIQEILSYFPTGMDLEHASLVSSRLRTPSQMLLFKYKTITIPRSLSRRKSLLRQWEDIYRPQHELEQKLEPAGISDDDADSEIFGVPRNRESFEQQLLNFSLMVTQNPGIFERVAHLNVGALSYPDEWQTRMQWITNSLAEEVRQDSALLPHRVQDCVVGDEGGCEGNLRRVEQYLGPNLELYGAPRLSNPLLAILHLLPKLRSLSLVADGEIPLPTVTLAALGKLSGGIPPCFMTLVSLVIHSSGNLQQLPEEFLSALPNLTSLTIVGWNCAQFHRFGERWPEPHSPVSTLTFTPRLSSIILADVVLTTSHIEQTISLANGLEKFEYVPLSDPDW